MSVNVIVYPRCFVVKTKSAASQDYVITCFMLTSESHHGGKMETKADVCAASPSQQQSEFILNNLTFVQSTENWITRI